MLTVLTSHSADLLRLREEGFDLSLQSGHLIVDQVPYVAPDKTVKRGKLVMPLDVEIDHTIPPATHQAWFIGDHPCDVNGAKLQSLQHSSGSLRLAEGLECQHAFSAKPLSGRYTDYYAKVVAYVTIITTPARQLEPGATAQTYPVLRADNESDEPFVYMDTASTRARITAVSDRLRNLRIAIVGLGGTGGYMLDFMAKTPVAEIHLYDGDVFEQHTAFRSPGATTEDEIRARGRKVDVLANRYGAMHRGIVPHGYITEENVDELARMNFVFLAIDTVTPKAMIIERLESTGIPFVDVGMGLCAVNESLRGQVRTTISTPSKRDHVHTNFRIPLVGADAPNDYTANIQIAELNALNAAIAIIKWKKHVGFYTDQEHEHFSVYQVGGNTIVNEDCA